MAYLARNINIKILDNSSMKHEKNHIVRINCIQFCPAVECPVSATPIFSGNATQKMNNGD